MDKFLVVLILLMTTCFYACIGQLQPLLRHDVFEIREVNANNDLVSDLRFLDTLLDQKRIIFIGEADHGDGTAKFAKARLIKYLNEKLGFDVLIFERSFYELNKMTQFLKSKVHDPYYLLKEGFAYQELISPATESMFPSLIKLSKHRDFAIEGVDIMHNSWYSIFFEDDLLQYGLSKKLVQKYARDLRFLSLVSTCESCGLEALEGSSFSFDEFNSNSDLIANEIIANSNIKKLDSEFVLKVMESNLGLSKWVYSRLNVKNPNSIESLSSRWELRDEIMSKNLTWLISKRYDTRKIIVSTSTYHISTGISQIPTMADLLPDSIRAKSYFLPIVSYSGRHGYKLGESTDVIETYKRDSSSVEFLLHSMNIPYLFVDFNSLSDDNKNVINKLKMTPSSALNNRAKWTNIYNGVLFIDHMEPDIRKIKSIKDIQYLNKNLYRKR